MTRSIMCSCCGLTEIYEDDICERCYTEAVSYTNNGVGKNDK